MMTTLTLDRQVIALDAGKSGHGGVVNIEESETWPWAAKELLTL